MKTIINNNNNNNTQLDLKLNPQYIINFSDGESSFSFSIIKRGKKKDGTFK